MRKFVLAAAATFALVGTKCVWAADILGGLELSRPAQACAPYEHDLSLPGLWLGHFTGGRLVRGPGGERLLDWRDDYSCFPTARACARWESSLRHVYHSQEGYRTCLSLRGGGVRIRVIHRNVVRAKY